ncbi:ribosome biogenesis protein WDR12 homolog [Teleopsis dalmanni]|uniref:ribosome biogenesis protein WDR12 homolog n=1 Tax=Teleopsis dalmanni TaxID=139649 RepID=UPI0018CF9714|nr:ribosome biogenesis protein WDR12 homolog [Teleopsis dalmanni]
MEEIGKGQVRVHFKTKQEQYAIPDIPYVIDETLTTAELNTFINTLLKQSGTTENNVDFDFLLTGEYLHGRLCDTLREKLISFESGVELEYVERFPAPEPQDCLLHDDWVSAVHTCGKWVLTGSYDCVLNIWNVKGKHMLTISGHNMPVKAVTWISIENNIGRFISCGQDARPNIWEWHMDSNSVNNLAVCKGHERAVDCVGMSPDNRRFATGSWDTMLKVWSLDDEPMSNTSKQMKLQTDKTKVPILTLQGHRENVSSVQWMDSNCILTSSWDHTIKIWDLNMEGVKNEVFGNKPIFDASYSKLNNLVVTASADKVLRLYDPRSNNTTVVRNTYLGHQQWVQSVMWSTTEEHLFVSASYDCQNKLWDRRSTKAPLYDLLGHKDKVMDIDWSNPKYIVSGGTDNYLRVYKFSNVTKTIEEN